MSKYSGHDDFRDLLESYYNDNFDKFMSDTNSVIKVGDNSVEINYPSDLILYYSHRVDSARIEKDGYIHIVLSKISLLESDMSVYESLNRKYGSTLYDPFPVDSISKMKQSLLNLYKEERMRPVSDQTIV